MAALQNIPRVLQIAFISRSSNIARGARGDFSAGGLPDRRSRRLMPPVALTIVEVFSWLV
jgi:hypothetical protein